jgi:hypothetical protein
VVEEGEAMKSLTLKQAADKNLWLWLIPVLLISFWLGARGLDLDMMWQDERWAHSLIASSNGPEIFLVPFPQMITNLWTNEPSHPPGYYVLLHLWAALTGVTPGGLRAFSLLAGMLAIGWVYRLARDLVSPRAGLYAAALMAMSVFFIVFLNELRMYMLGALVMPFSAWVYFRILGLRRAPCNGEWLLLFGSVVAVVYTMYFTVLVYGAVVLYHLVCAPKTRRWAQMTTVMAAGALTFIVWLPQLLGYYGTAVTRVARSQSDGFTVSETIFNTVNLFANRMPLLYAGLALAAVFALLTWRKTRRLWFFTGVGLTIFVLYNAYLRLADPVSVRYLFVAWPLLALVGGLGLAYLDGWLAARRIAFLRLVPAGIVGLWAVFGGWWTLDLSYNSTINKSARMFRTNKVLYHLHDEALADDDVMLYVPDQFSTYLTNLYVGWYMERFPQPVGAYVTGTVVGYPQEEEYKAIVAHAGEGRLRFWVASMPDLPTASRLGLDPFLSDQGYGMCPQAVNAPEMHISLYARSPVCCFADSSPVPLKRYGDGIALVGIDPLPATVDQTLNVGTAWALAASVPEDIYSISFQILDADHNKLAQLDQGLADYAYTCQTAQLPLADVPDGDYGLWAAVYDYRTQARLPGLDLGDGGVSDLLHLGDFTVAHGS